MSAGPAVRGRQPEATEVPTLPALVVGRVAHARRGTPAHRLHHRVYQWLIDVDEPPRLPRWLAPLASFRPEDHLGGLPRTASTGTIGGNVRRYLAANGVDLGERDGRRGRIVMLANARVLGHVFDPLTVFWCFDADGALAVVVAEVHNTYGERHAYLLRPDPTGRDRVAKEFYVSPFYDVTGDYELTFRLSPGRVAVAVVLRRPGLAEPVFTASFVGRPRLADRRAVLATVARYPLMPQQVSGLIRVHGLRLWLRRLPVQPRPQHTSPKGV